MDSYRGLADSAIDVRVHDVPVRVAGRERLIPMKVAAGRPRGLQDVADLTAGEADDLPA